MVVNNHTFDFPCNLLTGLSLKCLATLRIQKLLNFAWRKNGEILPMWLTAHFKLASVFAQQAYSSNRGTFQADKATRNESELEWISRQDNVGPVSE